MNLLVGLVPDDQPVGVVVNGEGHGGDFDAFDQEGMLPRDPLELVDIDFHSSSHA